jgi:peptidoglycan/xylan/chitin deacetylase (PgdA/CDA1 family)
MGQRASDHPIAGSPDTKLGYNSCEMLGLLLTTAAVGVATGLGYNSMAPRSQLFGRTFVGNGYDSRQIALTFDDGPNDPDTLKLLEILDTHGIKATFFMIGRHVAMRPKIAEAVARAGHVIGNHTFSHPNLIFCSWRQIRQQLEDCERALTDAVGEHSRLFRPPHGGRRPDVLRIVRQAGLTPVMWSAAGYDWNSDPASQIETKVVRQASGGAVILLHDGSHLCMGSDRSQTLIATGNLIQRCQDQGLRFVTVPEMMQPQA